MITIRRILRFLRFLFRRFLEDDCPAVAGVLSYTTLLSLVPLMTVALAVLSAFPVFDRWTQALQDFIFANFVPATGELVREHLEQFVHKASRLRATGIAVLVLAALLMMSTIDRSLNAIWRVRRPRGWPAAFVVYWAVLTLGPLLIGVSLAVTSYLVSLPIVAGTSAFPGMEARLLALLPFVSTAGAFTLLYWIVPNRRVPAGHALAGGVLAALLFEAAKKGFALYVTRFAAYQAVYGVFAAVPVFLVWIYVSWVVILLGAEFTRCLGSFGASAGVGGGRGGDFLLAYRVIGHLREGQRRGQALPLRALAALEPGVPEGALEDRLQALEGARVVHRTESGEWALSRGTSDMTLLDLYRIHPAALPDPDGEGMAADGWNRALASVLRAVSGCLEQAMRIPLADLYRRDGTGEGAQRGGAREQADAAEREENDGCD